MKIVFVSDLHGNLIDDIPPCDILCICGDISKHTRSIYETANWFNLKVKKWLNDIPAGEVCIIAGNHDEIFYRKDLLDTDFRWHYLEDKSIEIKGLKIYGTPWTSIFLNWYFMKSEEQLKQVFDNIPEDTDILMTHGPPLGILDQPIGRNLKHIGSLSLKEVILKKKIPHTAFGHIHGSGGRSLEVLHDEKYLNFYNCSILNEHYKITNKPIVKEL